MAQAASSRPLWLVSARWIAVILTISVAGLAFAFQKAWLDPMKAWIAGIETSSGEAKPLAEEHGDEHKGHDHAGHNESNSLELSEQARKNIGLTVEKLKLQPFTRTITVPGMVVERAGRSTLKVTSPMTGIVTKIYPTEGESIRPGQKLFELRLTHEEIVQSQADLLRTAEELDVIAREIVRLDKASADGAIPGKTLLERKYEQQKLQAINRSQQQALLLHGLNRGEIDSILNDRQLLSSIAIDAPAAVMDEKEGESRSRYQIQELEVSPGQHVNAGDILAVLIDYSTLLIQGNAFEQDATQIDKAARQKSPVTAVFEGDSTEQHRVSGLEILYQGSRVDAETRATHFFVSLPNEIREDESAGNDRRFLTWRYRPGQRAQLQVAVDIWPDRIVLPVGAIAQDGVETYVFTPNGDHLDRRPVHVEYRDDFWVVIANDGSIFPNEEVAISGAQQLQLALKNKAGGGVDPHAGHNH